MASENTTKENSPKYKVIKLGGDLFAVIKIVGTQTHTMSKHKDRPEAERALAALKDIKTESSPLSNARALNVSYAKFQTTDKIAEASSKNKKDTLERNVRQLHRLGPKKDSDNRKKRRYNRIMDRVKAQMENRSVDPAAFVPRFTGKKLTDSERQASKDHYKATQDPEKSAKLADDRANAEEKRRKELEAKRKAAGGLADRIKSMKGNT